MKSVVTKMYCEAVDMYIVEIRYGAIRWFTGEERVIRSSNIRFTARGLEWFRAKTSDNREVIVYMNTFIPKEVEMQVKESK